MATTVVEFKGVLTEECLEDAFLRLQQYKESDQKGLLLLFDSPGGSAIYSEKLYNIIASLDCEARITRAMSVAAMLALAASHRSMKRGSEMVFHGGQMKVEVTDIDPESHVLTNTDLVANCVAFNQLMWKILKERVPGLPDSCLVEFAATNYIRLSAEQCLQYGIVHELFD